MTAAEAARIHEPARITEIDIGPVARTLAVLRWSDYALVIACGMGALGSVPELVRLTYQQQWAAAVFTLCGALVFGFAAYTGWRHVGVIDPRVWRSYLLVFPLLCGYVAVLALANIPTVMEKGWQVALDLDVMLIVWSAIYFAGVAVPGFICVLWLRTARISSMGLTVQQLVEGLAARGGRAVTSLALVPRANLRRGILLGGAGLLVLFLMMAAPTKTAKGEPSPFLRMNSSVNMFGFFLLIRARRHFQIDAKSLLGVDKRPPVLFLRSFADDERQHFGNAGRALLDFSLETRLANHFHHFGPFIAIGSPKEALPQPGAARVLLGDDEWQTRVLDWMKESNLIIMYGGTTKWVNWELQKVVESGRASSLILMFPEMKAWRSSRREKDIAARVAHVREVFLDTPWNEELVTFHDFARMRAMLFRPDGSMVMVKGASRSRDAYHLAALVAHHQLLGPTAATQPVASAAAAPGRLRNGILGTAADVVAVAGILAARGLSAPRARLGERLSFKKGELYYKSPVTEAQAKGVGDYLLAQGVFSDERKGTVQLDRQADRYDLRLVFGAAFMNEPDVQPGFAKLSADLSHAVLADAPIEVALCDEYLQPVKSLPITQKVTLPEGDIYYSAPSTEREARQVGKVLVDIEFLNLRSPKLIMMGRDGNLYRLAFLVDPARVSEPSVLSAFVGLGALVAKKALGGHALVLDLRDSELHLVRSEQVDPAAVTLEAKNE